MKRIVYLLSIASLLSFISSNSTEKYIPSECFYTDTIKTLWKEYKTSFGAEKIKNLTKIKGNYKNVFHEVIIALMLAHVELEKTDRNHNELTLKSARLRAALCEIKNPRHWNKYEKCLDGEFNKKINQFTKRLSEYAEEHQQLIRNKVIKKRDTIIIQTAAAINTVLNNYRHKVGGCTTLGEKGVQQISQSNARITDVNFKFSIINCDSLGTSYRSLPLGRIELDAQIYEEIARVISNLQNKYPSGKGKITVEIFGHADGYPINRAIQLPFGKIIPIGTEYVYRKDYSSSDEKTILSNLTSIRSNEHLALARAFLALEAFNSEGIVLADEKFLVADEHTLRGGSYRKVEIIIHAPKLLDSWEAALIKAAGNVNLQKEAALHSKSPC